VTFIYGTEGFPKYLLDALLSHRVKTVRLAYDADEAGKRAADRDAKRLTAHGIEVFRVKFPWGMDANEYAQKIKPAAKSLAMAVKAAEWMGGTAAPTSAPTGPEDIPHTLTRASSSESLAANELAADEEATLPEPSSEPDAQAPLDAKPDGPTLACQAVAMGGQGRRLERRGEYHTLTLGNRVYRVGGLDKNNSLEVLKVAVRLRHEENFHLDSFDMTRDGDRRRFIERAAEETGLENALIKRDLGRLLLALEEAQQQRLDAALEPAAAPAPDMPPEERAEAIELLKAPDLLDRISEAFDACGLVGEHTNRLAAYLACTSRKLDKPLAVIIQSTSAAGKSTLLEAVLAMFPEEQRVKYSAMTGQSLYYLGETNLKHKILAIVEEEGAEKASYALKLLQSEGELTIASTGKNPTTGRMETQEYHVEGPVMIFLTTTAVEIDEELLNRCLVLTVDESREQTERIHALQRQARTLEGLRMRKKRKRLLNLLRNVQRLIEPVDVANDYANALTFTTELTRTRRDNEKYLGLIEAIALLHQHQRPRETDTEDPDRAPFIRVTLEDIALANRIAPEILGRSLDELPPQTRRVYEIVKSIVRGRMEAEQIEQRFALISRREVRDRLGWGATQVRAHLERLRDLEYIAARYGRPGSAFQYELLTDCREPEGLVHIGLLDVEKLRVAAKPSGEDVRVRSKPVGENGHLSGGCRPPARQVEPPANQPLSRNLSAYRDRTSGAPAVAAS